MTALGIQDAALRSGLTGPTLRYYEEVGLVGPIETLRVHLGYLHAKAALWDARDRQDKDAESQASEQVQAIIPRLEEVMQR